MILNPVDPEFAAQIIIRCPKLPKGWDLTGPRLAPEAGRGSLKMTAYIIGELLRGRHLRGASA